MRYRPFGNSGFEVSELGFGGWGIGGRTRGDTSYGDTEDSVSIAALHRAIDRGVTFFDTSNVYGDGRSEELIGRAIKGRRSALVVATKTGWTAYDQPADYAPEAIERSLVGSLKRLSTDYLDVLQLHNPPPRLLTEAPGLLADFLQGLKQRGLTRAIGLSLASPDNASAFLDAWPIDAIQVNLNLMDQRVVTNGVVARCETMGVAVVARSPLAAGFLTDAMSDTPHFRPGDHRKRWSDDQIATWIRGRRQFEAMNLSGTGAPIHQVAIRFCLGFPAVATTIAGMLTASEVDSNVEAITHGPLDDAAQRRALELGRTEQFFLRP